MLFCLCYVRLVRPVFLPRCECCGQSILVTLVLHYFMLPEDDPIEGLKHIGDILNPF